MDVATVGLALGIFSIALGLVEVFGARFLAGTIAAQGYEPVIRLFGAREIATGLYLLAFPTDPAGVWARVAGDVMDLAALALLLRLHPRHPMIWVNLGLVAGATAIDAWIARWMAGAL
ncbi:hypothetical protein [Sphingomonas montanisoli]|uniref:DUF4267 domain-containing protein n=1 Tax=Sphingomonas montanisoli TaxID=2606412 RepID=A0A5D9C854_9SPHN|nr:hypothetical protein [Sphingomonas montanisoli]TZG26255.1 hypothetical protein FYJ91_15040 [Sphingomonas montanisoli]